MTKFSDSNYDILQEYFNLVIGGSSEEADSWLLGIKKGILTDGSIADVLYEDNPDYGFVPYVFIIEEIDGNKFKMFYTGINLATHSINGVPVSAARFEVGNDMYFRKDSFFYEYLVENQAEYRNFINTNRTFCFFGKIWPVSEGTNIWNIEFEGMKDYMERAFPEWFRTEHYIWIALLDIWFDQVNHEPYNMTKYLWALLDAKEIDFRWLGYIASIYSIEINEDIDEFTLREWVDLLVYFLKRVGTFNDLYVVYNVFSAGSLNKINVYERWQEWCQSGAGDIPPFKEFPNFFPSEHDYHWLEFYGIHPSGGAGTVWYDQFSPSGIAPGTYSIDMNPYPTLALEAPSSGCDTGSATPTGSPVISPHYITEIDLTTEPIGDNFEEEWILNKFYIDEFIRNWEYVRPVGKYVQYQELIAPACAQSRTGETESLYPVNSLGYFDTTFTGSQLLSGSPPTDYSGEQTYVYTQYGSSANWTITHSLATSAIDIQVWKPTTGSSFQPMERIIPNTIEIIDNDTVHLTFGTTISGIANIAGYSTPDITFYYDRTGSASDTWLMIHGLGTAAPVSAPIDFGSLANFWTSPSKAFPEELELISDDRTQATWESSKSGEALVRTCDYTHVQDTPSTTWNINHNTGTDGMIIQTFNSSNEYINPISVTLPNRSRAVIEFETAQSGEAYFIWFAPDTIARTDNDCDITGTGMCPDGLGYWQVGNGVTENYDPTITNGLESPTASGDYWRVWQDLENYYIDFIVPVGEELTIREVGLFNVNDDLIYYSTCSELHKPEEVQTVFHYRSQALWVTESSSSSSISTSSSSSSKSSSSSSLSSSSSSESESSSSSISSSSVSSSSTQIGCILTYEAVDFQSGGEYMDVFSDGHHIFVGDRVGGLRVYENDGFGNLTQLDVDASAPAGRVWAYSPLNRVFSISNNSIRSYVVDGAGQLTHTSTYNGGAVTFNTIWGDGNYLYASSTAGVWSFEGLGTGFLIPKDNETTISGVGGLWTDGVYLYGTAGALGLLRYGVGGGGALSFIDSDYQGTGGYNGVFGFGPYIYVACTDFLRSYTRTMSHIDAVINSYGYNEVWCNSECIYVTGSSSLFSYIVDAFGNLTYIDKNPSYIPGIHTIGVHGDTNYSLSPTSRTFIYTATFDVGIRSYSVT